MDIMLVQPCCAVFGLIGFSGRRGREAENLAFMAALASHYEGDWWFESQFAFALAETGALDRASLHPERSLAENPGSAYSSSGLLYGHLAWHEALWCLELG